MVMEPFRTEKDDALAGVLSLCTASQHDLDALQRYDDAALASLDINYITTAEVGFTGELLHLRVV